MGFLFRWVKMWSNKHYCTFLIDLGNQTKLNVPSVEINVRFFAVYFPLLLQFGQHRQRSWASGLLNKTNKMQTVKWNTKEEVQQYNEVGNMLYILYLNKDCAVFCLNAAGASSGIIHAVTWDSYPVYLIWYKKVTCSRTKLFPFRTYYNLVITSLYCYPYS